MKREFEQEAQELRRKLYNCSEKYQKLYLQLKWAIYFQLITLFCFMIFLYFGYQHCISSLILSAIISLMIIDYTMMILHLNKIKNKLKIVYAEGTSYMGRLSDIIDWSSIRNRYITKDDKAFVNSITFFVLLIEKPLSPFRHFFNYYRLILYLSTFIHIALIICNISLLLD